MENGLLSFPGQIARAAPRDGGSIQGLSCISYQSGFGPTVEHYQVAGAVTGLSLASQTMVNARVYAIPHFISRDTRIDKLGVEVSTGGAGSFVLCGIYESAHNDLYPGRLLCQSEQMAGDSIAALIANVRITLPGGRLYWFAAMAHTGAMPVMRSVAVGAQAAAFGIPATLTVTPGGVAYYTHVAGPLPQVFAKGATRTSIGFPMVVFRSCG